MRRFLFEPRSDGKVTLVPIWQQPSADPAYQIVMGIKQAMRFLDDVARFDAWYVSPTT